MNYKLVNSSDSIDKAREYIKHILPHSEEIKIKIDKLPSKDFRTKILVNLPEKQLVAIKIAKTYLLSLEKAEKAIIKQAERKKRGWKKRSRLKSLLHVNVA